MMNKYDLLRKAELLGLATILSITGAKVNNVVNQENKVGITQTIDAKVKQPKPLVKYFKNTKIKQSVTKTTLWPNGKKKKVVVTKYNKQKQVTSKVTKTYNNKGVILKSVKIVYNYKNSKQFKTITTVNYVKGKATANKATTTTKVENKNGTWSETTKVYDNNKKPTTSTTTGSNTSTVSYKTTFVKEGYFWFETTTQYTNDKIVKGSTEVRKKYKDADKKTLLAVDEFVYTSASAKRLEKGNICDGTYLRYAITYENNKPVKLVRMWYYDYNHFVNNIVSDQVEIYLSGKKEQVFEYQFDSTNNKTLISEGINIYQSEYNTDVYAFINEIEPKNSNYIYNKNIVFFDKFQGNINVYIVDDSLNINAGYNVDDSTTYIRVSETSLPYNEFRSPKVVTDQENLVFYGYYKVAENNYLWVQLRFNKNTGAYTLYKITQRNSTGDRLFDNLPSWTIVAKSA